MSGDPTRRDVIKQIGAGTTVATAGLAQSAAAESPEELLDRTAVRRALSVADVDAATLSFSEAQSLVIQSRTWIKVPVADDGAEYLASDRDGLAEVSTGSHSGIRVDTTGDETTVEDLEFGPAVLGETLELVDDREWTAVLSEVGVQSIDREHSSANVDHTSGIRRVFATAETNGQTVSLLIEVAPDGTVERGFDLTQRDDASKQVLDCWTDCIRVGSFCKIPCKVCLSTRTPYTCAPCAVCIGGSATTCLGVCGISKFW